MVSFAQHVLRVPSLETYRFLGVPYVHGTIENMAVFTSPGRIIDPHLPKA